MNNHNCFLSLTITDHQRRIQTGFLCLIANKKIAWYIHIDLPTEKANNQINLMRSDLDINVNKFLYISVFTYMLKDVA